MKKLLRILLRLGIFALIILAGIMGIKTLSFSSRQIPVETVQLPPAPEQAPLRLAKAISFPTVSKEGWVDTAAFLELDTFLRNSFPLVDSLLELQMVNNFSRLYRWPGQNAKLPPILLIGHLDVVPVEAASQEAWTAPPFGGEIRDDKIWGRGALDDKVSCLGLLEAVEQLLREDYTPGRTVYLAFGHDEETGGKQGAVAIAEHLQKKGLSFDYVLDEGQVILSDALPGLEAPLAMIGIAEKGAVSLRLTARLKDGGHSSMPPSETAIGVLSEAIHKLENNPFPARIDGAAQAMLKHAGPEMFLPYKALFANLWLTEPLLINVFSGDAASNAIIRTTTAPTMIEGGVKENVLPVQASATVNFRILPGETVESVQGYVQNTIDDERITVKIIEAAGSSNPSPVSPANSFGFQVIQRTIQETFPEVVVAPSLVIAATDSRHYTALSDHIYRFLPVQLEHSDLSRFHGIDERIEKEQYWRVVQFYRRLVENSCR